MADSNVYSLNVVGYVNWPLKEGNNLVANPLDLDLTGTNNTLIGIFGTAMPINTKVQTWNGVGFNLSTYAYNKSAKTTNWTANLPLNPGIGMWVTIPAGAFGGATVTNQFPAVGNVLQGALINANLAPAGGLSLLGSMVPLAAPISTFQYLPKINDKVQFWNGVGFDLFTYAYNKSAKTTNWAPSEPQLTPGVGFWLNNPIANTWTQNFTVQ
jgi:hypothetical protein